MERGIKLSQSTKSISSTTFGFLMSLGPMSLESF